MSSDEVTSREGESLARRPSSASEGNRRRSTVGSSDDRGSSAADLRDDPGSRAPVERSSSRASVASTSR